VTVVDDLLFDGGPILPYMSHPDFRFVKGNVCDPGVLEGILPPRSRGGSEPAPASAVVHLAAIVGFPACQAVGEEVARRYNVLGTERVFDAADRAGVERFLMASTYSNYGLAEDGRPVTEESPLHPQSLYAETKIAAEQLLIDRSKSSDCAPIIYRFSTLFGISPRTRFDLILNQFVLEAMTKRKLVIYQRGYARAFVHVRDVCDALCMALDAPLSIVSGEVFNVGSEEGSYTKDEIVELVRKHVADTRVEHKDLSFGGDMRDIRVSFDKIRSRLGYEPRISVEQGIVEVQDALETGLIGDPSASRYRNAHFIVQ
jgi:nucleoside-diphosphate-sugar epimerase